MASLFLVARPSLGRFDQDNRSINNTGEALPEGGFEFGGSQIQYGLTENVKLNTNLLVDVTGGHSLGASYTLNLPRRFRLTPEMYYAQTSVVHLPYYQAGLVAGLNRGGRNQHSFAVKFVGRSTPIYHVFDEDPATGQLPDEGEWRRQNFLIMSFDYSYYTPGGNLFFVGSEYLVPYIGFTWAWENIHLGFVVIEINSWSFRQYVPVNIPYNDNFSFFVPLPYIYLRF